MSTALPTRLSRALQPWFGRTSSLDLPQEMDDLLSRLRTDWNGDSLLAAELPSVDLSETDDALQIRVDVPGIKADEIHVEVTGNTIRIRGEHTEEKEEKGRMFHRVERRSGSFARALTLPAAVKEDKISAECKDGVLTITLPKAEVAKTKQVKVLAK